MSRGPADAVALRLRRLRGLPGESAEAVTATPEGIEGLLALIVIAFRAVTMILAVPSLIGMLARSHTPGLDLAIAVLFGAWIAAHALLVLRLRTIRWPPLAWVDAACSCVVLVTTALLAPAEMRVGSWAPWAFTATATSGLLAGMAIPTWYGRVGAALALAAATLLPSVFLWAGPVQSLVAWTRTLAHPAYVVIGYLISASLRRIAAEAEDARRRATEAAAEAEAARHRALLHDQATILELVAQGIEDPALARALRKQAHDEARKVAAFMSRPSPAAAAAADDADLARLTQDVTTGFADLRLVVSVDLAEGTLLAPAVAAAVRGALTTVLHNVRRHSAAEECVVHAERDDGSWELTVRDDGVGFDPDRCRLGYGLTVQVQATCRQVGVETRIESAPGEGTLVRLVGGPDTTLPRGGSTRGGRNPGSPG